MQSEVKGRDDHFLNQKKERILWLDLARFIAIVTVILVHATESMYKMNAPFFNNLSLFSKLFAHTTFTIGRIGVPIFLFLTGYLLLGKYNTENDCKLFWKEKWVHLVITTEIWILIYNVFLIFTKNNFTFDLIDLFKEMVFINRIPVMSHMWYMPMIIGMYLFLPIFSRALYKLDVSALKFPLVLIGVYLTIIPMFNVYLGGKKLFPLLDFGYSGGLYGFYILLGFTVKCSDIWEKTKKSVLLFGLFCSFIITILLQYFSYLKGVTYNVWYNCGSLVLCSICLFVLLSNHIVDLDILGRKTHNYIHTLSIMSFSIYLIHFPILLLLKNCISNLQLFLPVKVLVLWFLTFILSLLVSVFLGKFNLARKYLLYIKSL